MIKAVRYFAFSLIDSQSAAALMGKQQMTHMRPVILSNDQVMASSVDNEKEESAWIQTEAEAFPRACMETLNQALERSPKNGDWIKAELIPNLYQRDQKFRHSATTYKWAPEYINPASVKVYIHRDGRIVSHGRPRLARECLEPAGQGGVVIGTMDSLDQFYANNSYPEYEHPEVDGGSDRWSIRQTLDYANRMLNSVSSANLKEPINGLHYQEAPFTLLVFRDGDDSSVKPLLAVYDAIETLDLSAPCLERFTLPLLDKSAPASREPDSANNNVWGTLQPGVDLSDDQGIAVVSSLDLQDGEVQAINGPPGTGKTAILKEIVASTVVLAALNNEPPPLIAISSTNNQAIRNAMSSLTKHTGSENRLHQRWITGAPGHAVYAVSQHGEALADANQLYTMSQLDAFEADIDIGQAEVEFCRHTMAHLKRQKISSAKDAVAALQSQLKISTKTQVWARTLRDRIEQIKDEASFAKIQKEVTKQKSQWLTHADRDGELASTWSSLETGMRDIDTRFKESSGLIKEFKKHRKIIHNELATHPILRRAPFLSNTEIGSRIAKARISAALQASELPAGYITISSAKKYYTDQRNTQRRSARVLLKKLAASSTMKDWEAAAEKELALRWRYNWFWLAVHIREGQWISLVRDTLKNNDPDKRTHDKVMRRLHRHAALTPVLVATLHRLPKVLTYWDIGKQSELPLMNALDHLIIDEAGQCSPDITSASLALTKKATLIGDRAQLEPVWSVTEREDAGNRVASGLMTQAESNGMRGSQFTQCGGATSVGSALWLAQQTTTACEGGEQPGLWLKVNRRSVPDILSISNMLCYKNALKPGREAIVDGLYPALGTLAVPGTCLQSSGSRINYFEASVIAEWLAKEQSRIVAHYDKQISECVAVITPFKAQADLLQQMIDREIGSDLGVVVGTVHSMQGAEKPIIILSLTYSADQHPQSMFFDQQPTMLNVAASRGQDSLIIAGDVDVLNRAGGPGKTLATQVQKLGSPVPWHPWSTETIRYGKTLWGSDDAVTWLTNVTENPLALALSDETVNELIIAITDMDAEGLQSSGQLMIKAVREGFRITLIMAQSTALEHSDASRLGRGLDVLQKNGVGIRYVSTVLSNKAWLSNGMMMISQSSWLCSGSMEHVIVIQDRENLEMNRIKLAYGLQSLEPAREQAAG